MASISRSLRAAAPLARGIVPRAAIRTPIRAFSSTKLNKKHGFVGISEYAAEQLGDVVYVELPEAGTWVEQGDAVGAVESVKSASDINAPVRLRVLQVNDNLEEKPSTINKVPEDDSAGGGWIAKVEVDEEGAKQFEKLLDAEAYKTFAGAE
ncbi:hypothetical protein BFJ68_g88 [Fusarium oxysporum]|uniref:Lipoyl-binding domain-containing protein n=1 Tax=Fusarium oxysporum TaxID=5507 RepID=A0A420S883_FUSOX|nr:hypothetical protein BFJ68_g88 [Fusarium oxysporum]